MPESSLIKLQVPRTTTLLKIDSNTGFSCGICEIFKNTLSYRTSPVAGSDTFKFPACNFIKKDNPAKLFFCEFCKIFKNIFSFDRKPPDDCFLYLSVNFEKFFRILLLYSPSGKLLVSCTSCRISTTRYSIK